MEYFQVKSFRGVNTRIESTDQDRGTLRRLEGAVIAPNGGISSPVPWETLWGITDLETTLAPVLVGKTTGHGYFFQLENQGNKVLIFYEVGAGLRSLWWIAQSDQYPLTDGSPTVDAVVVEDADTAAVNGTYVEFGTSNGRTQYLNDIIYCWWSGSLWRISGGGTTYWESTDNVLYPWLATTWTAVSGTGSAPTVRRATVADITTITDVGSAANVDVDLTGSTEKVYYGCPINDDLWLGHGEQPNYIWHAETGLVEALGATAPTDNSDPGREQFPPCKSFVQMSDGVVVGAGHTAGTYSATRLWLTNPPSKHFPHPERIYNLETSYVDLHKADATEITALSTWQEYVTVHTDRRPWVIRRAGAGSDGYFAVQDATPLAVSAPNQNCTRDLTGIGEFWFGQNREIYDDNSVRGSVVEKDYGQSRDIVTDKGDNIWNDRISRNPAGSHTIFDRVNNRFYIFAPLKTSGDGYTTGFTSFGCYVWIEQSRSVSGPMLFPNATASTTGRRTTNELNKTIVATAEGGLMFADLDLLREREEFEMEDYDATENAEFTSQTPTLDNMAAQTSYAWLQATTDRDIDGYLLQFPDDTHGTFKRFARTTIDDSTKTVTLEPASIETIQWANATVARLEFAAEDFGRVNMEKVFQEVRLTWQRDSKCYVGIFARTDYGQKDGYWIGNPWPSEEQMVGLNIRGRRLQVTVLVILSNDKDARAMLRDMTIGYLPGDTAQG